MATAHIPPKTMQRALELQLTESIINDVFSNGTKRPGADKMTKQFKDYRVEVSYAQSAKTGEYIITWVNKWTTK